METLISTGYFHNPLHVFGWAVFCGSAGSLAGSLMVRKGEGRKIALMVNVPVIILSGILMAL